MSGIEQKILLLSDEIDTLYLKTGDTNGELIGNMRINLKDWQERRSADEIIADIQEYTKDLAGVEIELKKDQAGPPVGKDLQVEIGSRFPYLLQETAEKLHHLLMEKKLFYQY